MDDDLSIEELERQQAVIVAKIAEKQRLAREDLENRSTSNGAKVLVHKSPSPKKKRTREDDVYHRSASSRPHAPSFHDSTQAGPPVYSLADSLAARSSKVASSSRAFASHESALPRESSLLKGLEEMDRKRKREAEKKNKVDKRSTGFALGGSSRDESSSRARAGGEGSSRASASRDSLTRKGKEREKEPATRRSAAELELASALAVKPAMARHVPAKAVPGPPPARRRVEKPDESESEDEDGLDVVGGPPKDAIKRRKDGTVIETLEVGPRDHKWSKNDPLFEKTEPNSGIRFRANTSRQISHEQLQLHLSDRYHLSPQQLYSLARTSTNNNVEIDVDRDFIVIGVLAWKDETRYVSAPKVEAKPVARKPWEHVNGAKEGASVPEEQRDVEAFGKREQTAARRYLRFTFVDLSTEEAAASGTGTLNLMLFEATKEDETVEEDGYRIPRYRGGSGGAYEKFWKEAPGAVVAILNPRVSRNKPQPGRPNVLTITPESADAMMVIGQARDLRSCEALRRDTGKACGDWCDARVSSICEYHTNLQLKRTSSRRAETFSANSSLLANASFDKKKFTAAFKPPSTSSKSAPYDPEKKIGLLPRNPTISMQEGAKTYVVSSYLPASGPSSRSGPARGGSVLTTAGLRPASILHANGGAHYIPGVQDGLTVRQHEKDREERALQNAIRKEAEKDLMEKDLGKTLGGQYLELAAKARKAKAKADEIDEHHVREKAREKARRRKRTKGNDTKAAERSSDSGSDDDEDENEGAEGKTRKKPFSTSAVRLIGYDPTRQGVTGIEEDEASRLKRLEAIDSLKAIARAPPSLGPPPGPRIRSVVAASTFGKPTLTKSSATPDDDQDLPDMRIAKAAERDTVVAPPEDSDDDDLVVLPKEAAGDSPDVAGGEAEAVAE